MVIVDQLVKDFGARRAVDQVSFKVEKGTVLGFLGPNGAGKSTTMRMITGFLQPTSGTASIDGHDILKDPVKARHALGYLPENAPSYGTMTIEEFLDFAAAVRGFSGREAAERVQKALERCFLENVRHQTIETLSKGYRQRTCLAQALLHDPPVLIMDEPTDGLDPNQKKVVRDMIREMAKDKVIILSTHVLEEVEAICSRVVIISSGKLVSDSTPDELRKMSRYFNAVDLVVGASEKDARERLGSLPGVKSVEVLGDAGSGVSLRLLPEDGAELVEKVLAACQEKNWPITSLTSNPGRLDDVFQSLTTTEDVVSSVKEVA